MPEIKINNIAITASPEDTILSAAERAGIPIPTMCWIKDFKPSTSCMVCVVQDLRNGKIVTSCSALVEEGMDISTDNEEVLDMRKSALDLLLSEHNGDCEAPCQRVCPAEMNIPLMNRLISENRIDEALKVVKETIAIPAILGYICPAPCEKACRRKDIDEPVSICLLKRFVSENEITKVTLPHPKPNNAAKIAIIGAGAAGLSAAFYLAQKGFNCHIYDSNELPGGMIRTSVTEDQLPRKVLDQEIEAIKSLDVAFYQNQTIRSTEIINDLSHNYPYILLTTGAANTIHTEDFEQTTDSDLKELTIYKVNNCIIFAPTQVPSKSNLAVRAAALGRKSSQWITEYIEKNRISMPAHQFNSVYRRITVEDQDEFLKEAKNHSPREKVKEHLQGFSKEDAIKEAGRCLHCDCRKKEACILRALSSDYKASQRVYTLATHPKTVKNTDHDLIVFETLKCIKCGICIQTAQAEGDKTGFAYVGRGFDVQLAIPIEKNIRELTNETVISCAKNCPTGAISLKKN